MQRRALLAGVAAGTTALAGCADAGSLFGDPVQETRERYFEVPDGTRIRVENENGDVSVTGRDRSDASVDATVTVPGESRLDDVTVSVNEDENGDLAVDVDVSGDASDVTVDLDLRVPESVAMAPVQTENGDVEVRGVAGVAAARSVNGDVTVRNADSVSSVSSANGDVAADVPAPLPGDVLVRTENGDINAALSPDIDAVLDARSETDYVRVDDLELQNERDNDDGHVTGTLGDGTHDVTIATLNGRVEVQSLG